MKEQYYDDLEIFTEEELLKEEEELDAILRSREDLKHIKADESLGKKIFDKINEPELENDEEHDDSKIISMLSEEAREALMLGRAMQNQQNTESEVAEKRVVRRKKKLFTRIAILAAAVGVMFAMGINSVGGPERIIDIIKQAVGGREIEMIDSSSEETLDSGEDGEEKAYQQIQEEYGVSAVKIMNKPEGLLYKKINMNQQLQSADLSYTSKDAKLSYSINCSYSESSIGIDIEDTMLKEEEINLEKTKATVKTYKVKDTGKTKYIITFEYQKIYYSIVSGLNWEENEIILQNLHFS